MRSLQSRIKCSSLNFNANKSIDLKFHNVHSKSPHIPIIEINKNSIFSQESCNFFGIWLHECFNWTAYVQNLCYLLRSLLNSVSKDKLCTTNILCVLSFTKFNKIWYHFNGNYASSSVFRQQKRAVRMLAEVNCRLL